MTDATHQSHAADVSPARAIDARLVERFALAIARPGTDALLIDENNQSTGYVSVREAARVGVCFAVELADDVVGLDVDQPTAAHYVLDVLMRELQRRGIPMVVQNSGTVGHLHVFARVVAPDLKAQIESAAGLHGCGVRLGQRIRPPLSPHRLGLPVSLIYPVAAADALRALAHRQSQSTPVNKKRTGPSGRMFKLLREGDREGRYRSRSEVIQAVADAAVNAGFSETWLRKVLLDSSNRGGEKVQEICRTRGEAKAQEYVHHSYEKARAFVAARPAFRHRGAAVAAIIEKIDGATDVMLSSVGTGQAGATDYCVLTAHLKIARRVGSLTYGASCRELAEIAGVSRSVVVESQRRLIALGLLKRVRRFPITTASRWRIRLPEGHHPAGQSGLIRGRETDCPDGSRAVPVADVWRRGRGLGPSKYRIWSMLNVPMTAAEFASKLGITVPGVVKHLRHLENLGLCARREGRWHQRDTDLDAIAAQLGIAGEAARQHARYEYEREIYQQRLRRNRGGVLLVKDEG